MDFRIMHQHLLDVLPAATFKPLQSAAFAAVAVFHLGDYIVSWHSPALKPQVPCLQMPSATACQQWLRPSNQHTEASESTGSIVKTGISNGIGSASQAEPAGAAGVAQSIEDAARAAGLLSRCMLQLQAVRLLAWHLNNFEAIAGTNAASA